ncbi:hypothetical protein Acr_15g0007210 [Actinidia rufa]|uniref:CCHC-type domain-containing protein n=1 Tax=Actinidia rufa TaxID=165716 RepID=A0A7J0FTT3_9ERIC|nr:hypothetical protein Acr_15g0007210 [Actinidia rufa]
MGPKRGRARMVGRGRGGRGATGRGTPIEDVGDQGVASQTQQGVDRGVTSRGRSTRQGAGRGNPTPVVPEAHSGAGGRETAPEVPVIPSQFAREVAAAMLEMERTRHEEIRIQREATSARFRDGMKEFRKMNPPSFDGLGDPVVAGHWLSQIRKIFDTVRITEDDMKVSFASYQLVDEANEWWESIKETKGVDHGMSWADFESTFEDQYFPEAYRDELREQFEKLVQGDMTVSDQRIRNFSDLLDCARRVEPKREQRKELKGNWESRQMSVGTSSTTSGSFSKKRQRDSTQGSVGQQSFGVSIPASSSNPSNPGRISRSQIVCHRCNQPGHIRSECPQRVCYNCGQQGHISTNCPQGKNTHSGVGSVQQQSSGHTSNYQQRHQQQRNQSQQPRQSVASERGSRMERGDASTASKQFSGQRGGHVQSQGVQGRVYAITDATTIPSQTEPSVVRGKANVVADALSRKVPGKLAEVASLAIREWKMMGEIGEFGVDLMDSTGRATLYGLVAQPTLVNQVIEAQSIDEEAEAIRAKLVMGEEQPGWVLHSSQGLKFQGKLFVPMSYRQEVLNAGKGH